MHTSPFLLIAVFAGLTAFPGAVFAQQTPMQSAMGSINNALATNSNTITTTRTYQPPVIMNNQWGTGQILRQQGGANYQSQIQNSIRQNVPAYGSLGHAQTYNYGQMLNGSVPDTRGQVQELTRQVLPPGITVDPYTLLNR